MTQSLQKPKKYRQFDRKQWISSLRVGDQVVLSGNLIEMSPFHHSRMVCCIYRKMLGVVCLVESVTPNGVRVGGYYFNRTTGSCSASHPRYVKTINPIFLPNQ